MSDKPAVPQAQTDFEQFALDHNKHRHCMACGGCLLDPRWMVQEFPAWCIGCRDRIKANLPPGVPPPWKGGWEFH
jgi:hypothetical protein